MDTEHLLRDVSGLCLWRLHKAPNNLGISLSDDFLLSRTYTNELISGKPPGVRKVKELEGGN